MLLWKNLLKTSTGALFLSWEGISVISLSLLLRREHFHHLVLTFSPSLAFCFLPVLLTPTVSYSCSSSTCCVSDTSSPLSLPPDSTWVLKTPPESFLAPCCGVCVLLLSLLVTFAFLHSFLIPLFFSPSHMSLFPFHCIHILILRMECGFTESTNHARIFSRSIWRCQVGVCLFQGSLSHWDFGEFLWLAPP